jgi:hypothetical protein
MNKFFKMLISGALLAALAVSLAAVAAGQAELRRKIEQSPPGNSKR